MDLAAPQRHKVPIRALLLVLALALLTNSLALMGTDPKAAGDGDGPFYIGIARNVAAGNGYIDGNSFWPQTPTMGRAPVWPALLTIPSFLFSKADDHQILRGSAAVLNAGNALLVFLVAWTLSRRKRVALLAGVAYAIYPVALALVSGGFSEIAYIFCGMLGLLVILGNNRKSLYIGALILGLGPLVRSNFVILPVMVAGAALILQRSVWLHNKQIRTRFAVAAVLFWLPVTLWILRNYALSGEFPVLSTIEGETLWGANNNYIATDLSVWGYWVMPDEIPGETRKSDLARTMSEMQINRYYHRNGMAFLKQHWFELPRLEVGKFIRAFVPVPWVANWSSYAVFFFRAVFYAAILCSIGTLRGLDPRYRFIATGMFFVLLLTVLIYYGTYRFTFCVEVFFLPMAAIHLIQWFDAHKKQVHATL